MFPNTVAVDFREWGALVRPRWAFANRLAAFPVSCRAPRWEALLTDWLGVSYGLVPASANLARRPFFYALGETVARSSNPERRHYGPSRKKKKLKKKRLSTGVYGSLPDLVHQNPSKTAEPAA
jgi:hypothetical protein